MTVRHLYVSIVQGPLSRSGDTGAVLPIQTFDVRRQRVDHRLLVILLIGHGPSCRLLISALLSV